MSAETIWNVKALFTVEKTIEIQADTANDAREKAMSEAGLISVVSVEWNDPEEE